LIYIRVSSLILSCERVYLAANEGSSCLFTLTMDSEPEANPLEAQAHDNPSDQRSQTIQNGHSVLFRLPSGDVKSLVLAKDSYVFLQVIRVSVGANAIKERSLSESMALFMPML
jgi:hypothetical protein